MVPKEKLNKTTDDDLIYRWEVKGFFSPLNKRLPLHFFGSEDK